MRRFLFYGSTIAVGFLIVGVATFAQERVDRPATTPLFNNPSYDSIVVAQVGDKILTGREFLLNYEFGPAFPKRGSDSKKRYLEYMINEKLLALDGYAMGLHQVASAKEMLEEIEGDIITEQLYRDDVAKKVRVTKSELAEGIRREHIRLKLKWLYEKSEESILEKHRLIRAGASFDSLFTLQLNDSVKQDERSMETTTVKLQRRNPFLAAVIDSLKTEQVSLPIKTRDGWYLVFIEEKWMNPILTQTEEMKLREDVERALVQQKSDSLSDRYLDRMMKGRHSTIQRRAFDILEAHLASMILPPEKFLSWGIEDRLHKRWGTVNYTDIETKATLVKLNNHIYTVGDFLKWYNARDTFLTFRIGSTLSFFASFQQFVWRMIRDKLLVERARARGYQRLPEVQKYKKWWEDKIVYGLRKNAIADSIPLSPDALQRYYVEHQRDYRDANGVLKPYERVADDVRRDYYNAELTKRLLHRILALKERYGVKIYEEGLDRLAVDIESDPRAIDVYAVKKGGTFPHRAFPSIDYEWQRWE